MNEMVSTLKEAKDTSLEKWNKILIDLKNVRHEMNKPCGFCFYKRSKYRDCEDCKVYEKCSEMGDKSIAKLILIEDYIEGDLIPFIENV